MKTFVILDSNALMHRSYHALPPLKTKKGQVVNAVYGFAAVLIKILRELKPDYIAATFDLGGPTFRDEKFKDYKAKRKKPAQEFYDQIDLVKEAVSAFQIPIYQKQGYEADDLIGTLVAQSEKKTKDTVNIIITGDLDTLQLVSKKTKVYFLKGGIKEAKIYDKKAVYQRYCLEPNQMVDFKALRGDPSDNIPGVKGIGQKTAVDLLQRFGSLGKIYKEIESADLNPKIRARLLEYKEQAFLSQYLAAIRKDVPVEFDLEKCNWQKFNKEEIIELFKKLDFNSLINRLPE